MELLNKWRLAVNERVQMKPLPEHKKWFMKLLADTNEYLKNRCTECGQLQSNIGGEYPCKICGMPLVHDSSEQEASETK